MLEVTSIPFHQRLLGCSALALAAAWPMAAVAQNGETIPNAPHAAATPNYSDTEIIVTAQKREQNIQSVPIAITAFSGKQVQQLGLIESTQIALLSPGVNISAAAGDQSRQFSIRGVTQNDFADHTEAPNAVYIDEAYMASQQAQVFAIFDLERVEVLKGPQGTLFGRNATGGLVHFITRKPTKTFEAYVDLTYGSYNQVRLEGAISGPLTNDFSVRVSGFFNRHDSIYKNDYPAGNMINPLTGVPYQGSNLGHDDTWNDNQWAGRAQLAWDNGGPLKLLVSGYLARQKISTASQLSLGTTAVLDANGNQINTIYAKDDPLSCEAILANGGCQQKLFSPTRPVQGGDFFGYKAPNPGSLHYSSDFAIDNFNTYHTRGVTGHLTWDVGNSVQLNAITNYVYTDKLQALDAELAPQPLAIVVQKSTNKTFTQELRANADLGRLKAVAGLYYLNIRVNYAQGFTFGAESPFTALFFGGQSIDDISALTQETKSYSAFGQIDYDLTDTLTFTAGVRGIREKKKFDYSNAFFANNDDAVIEDNQAPLGAPFSNFFYPGFKDRNSRTLWAAKAQLSYKPTSDLLIYGGYSRGVKAGGYNAKLNDFTPPTLPADIPYGPEKLDAYEGGFKATLFGGTSHLNGAVYYYHYDGYQAFVFSGVAGLVQNKQARFKGAELSFDTRPVPGLSLLLNAAYVDAKVKDLAVAPGLIKDVHPTFTPKWQLSGLARYDVQSDFNGGHFFLQADGKYQSKSFYNIRNFDADDIASHAVFDGQIGWVADDNKWSLAVFANNLFDKTYAVSGFDLATFCGCNDIGYGKPRWVGVRLHVGAH